MADLLHTSNITCDIFCHSFPIYYHLSCEFLSWKWYCSSTFFAIHSHDSHYHLTWFGFSCFVILLDSTSSNIRTLLYTKDYSWSWNFMVFIINRCFSLYTFTFLYDRLYSIVNLRYDLRHFHSSGLSFSMEIQSRTCRIYLSNIQFQSFTFTCDNSNDFIRLSCTLWYYLDSLASFSFTSFHWCTNKQRKRRQRRYCINSPVIQSSSFSIFLRIASSNLSELNNPDGFHLDFTSGSLVIFKTCKVSERLSWEVNSRSKSIGLFSVSHVFKF